MQTQYLNSLLATASQWGLSIDSETSSGNAGTKLFVTSSVSSLMDISFLYRLSVDHVCVCVRIGHHRAGRLDQDHPRPCEL